MKRTLKTLPITEQMYDYIFQHWRLGCPEAFANRFIFLSSTKEWNELLEDDVNWIPNKSYIYVKDDMTSILSRAMIFGDCPTPDYGRLGQHYYYIFTFRATANITTKTKIDKELNGWIAWMTFYKELKKYYTDWEIDERIKLFSTRDEDTREILHNTPFMGGKGHKVYEANKVYKLTNVKYYDINKAYASNLIKMFPRLKNWILEQYKVNKPYFKKVLNYSVGFMNHFYNDNPNQKLAQWHYLRNTIVTNTTNQMEKAMQEVNGMDTFVFYENTDGFMVANPTKDLEHSDAIGDFGEEIVDNGEVWFTRVDRADSTKYSVMQWFENGEKKVKSLGGFLQEEKLISNIDLSENKVLAFTTTRIGCGVDDRGKKKYKRVVDMDSIKEIEDYEC